jgi:HD-GYP domain-containing protein (c-di-GMP phosphodiesterase class II)
MQAIARLIAKHLEDSDGQAVGFSRADLAGIHALLATMVARDRYTGERSDTVVRLATRVAWRLGLADEQVREVEQVALLHDIGKVGIPDSVLQKEGPLNDGERHLMRQHPALGGQILASTRTLAHLAAAVRAEHERFDGEGYPDGLRGEAIPLASRITCACDAYHAMTSRRPYRGPLAPATARAQLLAGAGTQFDGRVLDALLFVIESGEMDSPARAYAGGGARRVVADVLKAPTPRQTPAWQPHQGVGAASAVCDVRAACRRCGTHVTAIVTRAAIGGNCNNCGSYELDLLEI